jgi:elongation factor G
LGHFSEVKGQIPQAELMPFFIDIKALTQGRVKVKTAFSHYENVPYDVQQKIVESRKADLVEN